MKNFIHKHIISRPLISAIGGLILLIVVGFGVSIYYLANNLNTFRQENSQSIVDLKNRLTSLEATLATTTLTSQELAQRLQEQNESLSETIDDIAGTVDTLEKLSKTDQELLQKYSKVYFLSDNYVPLRLKDINQDYLAPNYTDLQFHASAMKYLDKMFDAAKDDGISLEIISAYRSFGTQSTIKNDYVTRFGSGANQFVADQGYSEHQLGTTLDLTTRNLPGGLAINFDQTPAFTWLKNNAYKYGFILSYPKGNVYYQYEPWHWRFVGVKLATKLHQDNMNFSDMDQRDIDKYLVKIFD